MRLLVIISSIIGWLAIPEVAFGQVAELRRVDSLRTLYNRPVGPRHAELAIRLSDALLYSQVTQARDYALQGLALLKRFPNDTLQLSVIHSLASAYSMMGQTHRADSCLRVGVQLAKAQHNNDKLVRMLMNLALTYVDEGRNAEALPMMREALARAAGPEQDAIRPLIVNNLGMLYDNLGNYGQALSHYHRALREADRQNDQNVMGLAEGNIANIYSQLDNPQRAIQMLRKAAGHFMASNDPQSTNLCRLMIAGNYLDMNRPDSAQPLANWGLREARKTNMQTQLAMAHVLMARLCLVKHQALPAERHARQALALARQENEGMLAQSLMYLAKATSALGRKDVAIGQARDAVMAAFQAHNKNERREANTILAEVLEDAGQPAEALAVRKANEALSDSLYTAGFRDQFSYLQVTYETEKKEQRIAFLDRENELRKWQLRWLVAGLLLVVGLLAVVWALYRLKQRDARRIQRQKEQIERQSDQLTLLMRELHHRVKNNLQIVSSLLSLQSGRLTDQQARAAVREGQSRVEAMSMLHQRLYTNDDVTAINFSNYVTDLVENLMTTYGYRPDDFDLTLDITQQRLDTDTAIPLGLIINELITNSFKYAYRTVDRPALTVRLETIDPPILGAGRPAQLRLTVQDNGPGLPDGHPSLFRTEAMLVDMGTLPGEVTATAPPAIRSKTFGMQLVQSLTKQLRATCQFRSGNGLVFQLDMPFHFV